MALNENILFPPLEPFQSGSLQVDEIHTIYWEQSGNPNGTPVLFLHGGPGSGASPDHRRFFDPAFYRIIIFDQRGAGRSKPLAELRNNTPEDLISDIEKLRNLLNINNWLLFGGSWGSTLAIAYGEAHPAACLGFILRGVFLMRDAEIDWFIHGMRRFFPDAWEKFVNYIPESERAPILEAYYRRLTSTDQTVRLAAAKNYSRMEGEIATLISDEAVINKFQADTTALGVASLEVHYSLYNRANLGDNLLNNLSKINHLPAIIIQGRYDMCCPPITAYEVAKAWPCAKLIIIANAGHAASEPGTARELINATEKFKAILN